MTYPDVVIIGGGIVGCACAYYLSKAGVKVHLVERGPLGSGASKAGMTHVVTWEEPEIHLKLAKRSSQLYQELSQQLTPDIQYRTTGSIAIVEKHEGLASMQAMVGRLQAGGLKCRMLSHEDLLEMEPHLAPDLAGGAYFEEDGQVNPLYTTQALAAAARACGATIENFAEVTGIEKKEDGSISAVVTAKGRVPTGQVVIAAGAWSGQVGRLAGVEIPISPRKGTLVVTTPLPPGALLNCKIILSAGYMDSVKQGGAAGIAVAANLQQVENGNLLLGSSRQFVGFDINVDPTVVSLMLSRCVRFFPELGKITAIRTWAGLRPYTPDLLPIISPVDPAPGLYVAAGHEGIGITEAPVTGRLIGQLLTGQTPDIPLDELRWSRFEKK